MCDLIASTSSGSYQPQHKQVLSSQNGTAADTVAPTYSANSNLMNGSGYSNLDLTSAGGGSISNQHMQMQNNNSTVHSNLSAVTTPSLNAINPRAAKLLADYKQIDLELRAQNFDVIRFATYRTASKLRFIQKKLNLHLIDLWNVIETFRDNNLHTMDILAEIDIQKIEACVRSMYVQLNKRLALNQHINVDTQTQLLTAWLLNLYDRPHLTRIRVLSFKTALTTMCSGKLIDKIKYIFTQLSDIGKNSLIFQKFDACLKDLLQLPTSVYEEPSFGYRDSLAKSCFDWSAPIRLDEFINVVLSDIGPPCFIWLNIFHRFTIVQSVTHPVTCTICQRTNFNGFRYKCQKCRKYQLCQDCFWRGRVTGSHQLTHQMKEYTSYKSAAKQFSNSLKRSFFCKPNRPNQPKQLPQSNMPQQRYGSPPTIAASQGTSEQQRQQNLMSSIEQTENINNIMAVTSTSSTNNSDYNLLYRNQESLMSSNPMNQAQQFSAMDSNAIVAAAAAAAARSKKLLQANANRSQQLGVDDGYFYSNDGNRVMHQPLDLSHIVPPHDIKMQQQQQQIHAMLNPTPSKSPLNAGMGQYSNTLSMTRNKHGETINSIPNLLTNFILSSNAAQTPIGQAPRNPAAMSSVNSALFNSDEHNLIASYSSRLADFYAKNPHLSASPNTPSPSTQRFFAGVKPTNGGYSNATNGSSSNNPQSSKFVLKSNLKTRTLDRTNGLYNGQAGGDVSPASSPGHVAFNDVNTLFQPSSGARTNKTGSLSRRHLWAGFNSNAISKNQRLNELLAKQQQQQLNATNGIGVPNEQYTTRSMSESNFLNNENIYSSIAYGQSNASNATLTNKDLILKEKREIVARLEQQNREISKEIRRLRAQQISNRSLDAQNSNSLGLMNKLGGRDPASLTSMLGKRNGGSSMGPSSFKNYDYGTIDVNSTNTAATIAELQTLKNRKGQLESRIQQLQNSRNELIGQLDSLVKQQSTLKRYQVPTSPTQHMSTTSLLPNVSAGLAMPTSIGQPTTSSNPIFTHPRSWSTPSTPAMHELHPHVRTNQNAAPSNQMSTSLHAGHNLAFKSQICSLPQSSTSLLSLNGGMGGGLSTSSQNSSATNSTRNLRNDLLIAADSVTNAMQSLVKELNSENENMNGNCTSDDDDDELINSVNQRFNLGNSANTNFSINSNPSNLLSNGASSGFNKPDHEPMGMSLSATCTPVVYRKHQQPQTLNSIYFQQFHNTYMSNQNSNRNGINFEEMSFNSGNIDQSLLNDNLNGFGNNHAQDDEDDELYIMQSMAQQTAGSSIRAPMENNFGLSEQNGNGNHLNGLSRLDANSDDLDSNDSNNNNCQQTNKNEMSSMTNGSGLNGASQKSELINKNKSYQNGNQNEDEEVETDFEEDADENYLLNDSFINKLKQEAINNRTNDEKEIEKNNHEQSKLDQLQQQFEVLKSHQQRIQQTEQLNEMLMTAAKISNNSDQMSSWRRELEECLVGSKAEDGSPTGDKVDLEEELRNNEGQKSNGQVYDDENSNENSNDDEMFDLK